MKVKRLLIDLSSILWAGYFAGKDEEFGKTCLAPNGRTVQVNGAYHGYENVINSITSAWRHNNIQPKNTIIVEERGTTTLFRKQFLPGYKAGRDDGRPAEMMQEWNKLKELVLDVMSKLGATIACQVGTEADDVIAYLTAELQGEKVVMSNDQDLSALINKETSLWRENKLVTENPYGPFDLKFLPLYKALVGDTSDKIPGAKGFGDKAFLNLLSMFGEDGLDEVTRLIEVEQLDELEPNVNDLKVIQKILDNKETVYASYAAGKLYPERCNNWRQSLQFKPGFVAQRREIKDERLVKYAGVTRLVHQENYKEALKFLKEKLSESEYVSLDIETSMKPEAIEWLKNLKGTEDEGKIGVDVLGSVLNGLSLTFGANDQFTLYMTTGHKEDSKTQNLDPNQVLAMIKQIPQDKPIVVHNSSFEQPVLFKTWGEQWNDNGWHGFLPNVHDTMVLTNYVNENLGRGLKSLTKHYFDYDQTTYDEVTGGRRMDEMTAQEVLAYGADDTIMTAALYNHFKLVCEIEGSWEVYKRVEVLPAYLTAQAFVQGTKISREVLRQISDGDAKEAERLQKIIDDYLISKGWEGTVCPTFAEGDIDDHKKVKEIFKFFVGDEIKTQMRTASKIVALMWADQLEPSPDYPYELEDFLEDVKDLSRLLMERNIEEINKTIQRRFKGKPKFDINSPKQVNHLLYDCIGIPIRVINKMTELQRKSNPALANAVYRFNKLEQGSSAEPLTSEELAVLKQKASSDDTAIQFALQENLKPEDREFLEALMAAKTIQTRFNLFYTKYRELPHWETGRIHSSMNQCATVTRRYSSSAPNLQQLPKKGDGVKVRRMFTPHCENGVIVSLDFSGQELRLIADQSRDVNMLAAYIGDNKVDIHSLTAAGAMVKKWGIDKVQDLSEKYSVPATEEYKLFTAVRHSSDPVDSKLADDLRKVAKSVVFGSNYSAEAPTLAKSILIPVEDAQRFLDAKKASFPRVETWKDDVISELKTKGYVESVLGARRHLAETMLSGNKWEIARAERQGPNFMIQGSAAEQTKLVMAELWKSGALEKYDAQFIAPIHDELVCSVSAEDAADFIKVLHECMTIKYMKDVPEVSSISVGLNFADQIECGDDYDREAIMKALAELEERQLEYA